VCERLNFRTTPDEDVPAIFSFPNAPSSPSQQSWRCMTKEALLLRKEKLVETDIVLRNILRSGSTLGRHPRWRFDPLFFNRLASFLSRPSGK